MAKWMFMLAVAAAAAWWWLWDGARLDESQVRAFYAEQQHATLSRNPRALCDLLHPKFHFDTVTSSAAGRVSDSGDRAKACEGAQKTYNQIEQIGNKLGGVAQLDYDQQLENITIAPDRKSATVQVRYRMEIAGAVLTIRSSASETLVRTQRQVRLLASQSRSTLNSG